MERSLLDSDIFSELLRDRNEQVKKRSDAYLSVFGAFTLSVVTIAEIIEGFQQLQHYEKVDKIIERIKRDKHDILVFDFAAALIAGKIIGDLHRTGQPIGLADSFIAAIAIRDDIPLVTGNTRHFERIVALGYPLRLDNWRTL
jgi:tRNA(fMet)-specific endonuclease VapC